MEKKEGGGEEGKRNRRRRGGWILVRANLCRRKSSVMLDRKLSSTSPPADSGRSVSNTKCGPSVGNDLRLSSLGQRAADRITSSPCLVTGIITSFVNVVQSR